MSKFSHLVNPVNEDGEHTLTPQGWEVAGSMAEDLEGTNIPPVEAAKKRQWAVLLNDKDSRYPKGTLDQQEEDEAFFLLAVARKIFIGEVTPTKPLKTEW